MTKEDEVHCCIDCFKLKECYGIDVQLDDPDLCLTTHCLDYVTTEDLDN